MKEKKTSGYSGRPLSQKLGLRSGMRSRFIAAPTEYGFWLGEEASLIKKKSSPPWDFVHIFTNTLSELEDLLATIRTELDKDGMIWVSYYKKSSGLPSEITEDLIRDTCFPLGLVDIKVCAVSDEWSGLKLVVRKKLR